MTLVKFNQRPVEKSFGNLFEDLFNNFPNRVFGDDFGGHSFVPVNIKETKDAYQLEVVAPGLDKADFKVNIDNDILTISAEKKTETKDENEKQVRKEFTYRSFKRSFTIDEKIDASKIEAKYENGVLHLSLPKKEDVKQAPTEIAIQ